jgi:hypothetical protein
MPEQYEYDEIDMDALRRAMTIAMHDGSTRVLLEDKLQHGEPWHNVAMDAAGFCQKRALKLKPWDEPPCWGGEDPPKKAAALLDEMLAVGLSAWEPDPTAALAKVKTEST